MSLRLDVGESIGRVAIFLFSQALVYYSCSLFLIPKLLIPKRYFFFIIGVLITILISGFIIHIGEIISGYNPPFVRELHEAHGHHPGGKRMLAAFHRGHLIGLAVSNFATLFLSTIITFSSARQKRETEAAELKNRMLEAESKFLRSQINPHFLFNTLNNIYSLAQMQSDKTPDAIHRLSGLLRYVLYDSENEKVELKKELDYLSQFVELSLLKDQDASNVSINISSCDEQLQIAPLILIPFVENAFKHADIDNKEKGYAKIDVVCSGKELTLTIENSIGTSSQKDDQSGVGMENVKRRLELLYANKHDLKIQAGADKYTVTLKLALS